MFLTLTTRRLGSYATVRRQPGCPRLSAAAGVGFSAQIWEEMTMRRSSLAVLVVAVLAAGPMISISVAQAPPAPPPPVMPPSLPPTYVVDLMTQSGSAAFGAQWKTMEIGRAHV